MRTVTRFLLFSVLIKGIQILVKLKTAMDENGVPNEDQLFNRVMPGLGQRVRELFRRMGIGWVPS